MRYEARKERIIGTNQWSALFSNASVPSLVKLPSQVLLPARIQAGDDEDGSENSRGTLGTSATFGFAPKMKDGTFPSV